MAVTAADGLADGVCLAELVDQLPRSRGSVFELDEVLGITTIKGAGPGGRGRVAWVISADADRLSDAARRVNRGEVRIADLACSVSTTLAFRDNYVGQLPRGLTRDRWS